jgi:hypothetical protein
MLNQTFTPTGGASAYYGGVSMSWTGEAQARPATEPNFKQVHVVTNELAGLCKISRTLMSDSMLAMEAELKALFAGAIAYAEDIRLPERRRQRQAQGRAPVRRHHHLRQPRHGEPFKLADAANMMGAMLPQSRPRRSGSWSTPCSPSSSSWSTPAAG